MEIQTERCIIRDFIASDIDSFMEYRNNMDWMRYQGFKGLDKATYENELLGNTSITKGKQFAIVNTATFLLIGDIYLRQESGIYWIGYTINPVYARQNYAKEAIGATIKWIGNNGGGRIKAGVLPENRASIKLLEKLGFTYLTKENDELIYTYTFSKYNQFI